MKLFDRFKSFIGLDGGELDTTEIVNLTNQRLSAIDGSSRAMLAAFQQVWILRVCASKIAEAVASTTWHLRNGEGAEAEDGPALDLFMQPNTLQTGYTFMWLTQAYLEVVGEAVWLAIPSTEANRTGFEFLPFPPTAVTRLENGTWDIRLGEFALNAPDSNVIQIKEPTLGNPFGRGHGMAQTLVDELRIDESAAKHIGAVFENHARPDMMVMLPGATGSEVDSVKAKWYDEYGGPANSGKVMFAGAKSADAEMNAVQLSSSLGDTEARETRTDVEEKARKAYGIPPEIIGDSKDSNRATIEAAEYLFAKNVVDPRLSRLEATLNKDVMPLMPGASRRLYGYPSPIPEDREFKRKVMETTPTAFYINEARRLAGEDELDEFEGERLSKPAPAASPAGNGPAPPTPPAGDDEDDEDKEFFTVYTKGDQENDAERIANEAVPPEGAEEADEVAKAWAGTMESAAASVVADLDETLPIEQMRPAVKQTVDKRMAEYWRGKIDPTTRDQLRETLLDAFDKGKNPREIQAAIRRTFGDMKAYRAEAIARTEMMTASNAGTHEAHKESRTVQYRSWLHRYPGPNAREDHIELDARTSENPIPVEQPFEIKGSTAMHPGDFGEGKHDINCHCSTLREFPDRKGWDPEERDAQFRNFLDDLAEYRREFRPVVVKYFNAQQERALEAIDRILGER